MSSANAYAFAVFAAAEGAVVVEVPGILTQRYRKHSTHRNKSDFNDARAIAKVTLTEISRLATFSLAVTQRALRMRCDQRDRLVRERTKAVNRLRGAALLIGVTKLPADLTGTRAAKRIGDCVLQLRSAVSPNVVLAAVLDELDDACAAIELFNRRIKATEKYIRDIVRPLATELLTTRGISEVSAAGIIGHAGDMINCRSASAFANKCGAAPTASRGRLRSVNRSLQSS